MGSISLDEVLILLGEKDVLIYQLKKTIADLTKKLEEASKEAPPGDSV